jgi:hypothetical protein
MADHNQPAMQPGNPQVPDLIRPLGPVAAAQGQEPQAEVAPRPQGVPQRSAQPAAVEPGAANALAPIMPALAGQGQGTPVRHATFSSFYADGTCDPLRESAAAVFARIDPMSAAPIAAQELLDSISGDPTRPSAYLCCASLHGASRVYVVHMLSKFLPAMDGQVSPWDNGIFAYLGDVIQGQPFNVRLPNSIFDILPATYVYNEATLAQELPNLANGVLFPRARAANNTLQLSTRPLTYLPTKYAAHFLSNSGYTIQEIWARLIPMLQQDNLLGAAAPLVAWLRVTLHACPPNNTGPPATSLNITAPFIDTALSNHRSQARILTRIGAPSQGFEATLVQMANALVTQNAEARNARLVHELERDQPTLPSAKFNMLFTSLKSMLNVNVEAELPEFWFTLAAAPKKQEFSTVRDYLDAYSRTQNAFLAVSPIPTPKLLQDLTSATFVADHDDDLKTGIHPFIAMDGSAAYRQAAQDLARTYTVVAERDVSISLQDWDNLKVPKDLRSYPTSFFELEQNLGVFGNLIGAILGDTHPITVAYRPFWTAFCRRYRTRLHHEIDDRRHIKPVHILRSIQLLCFQWFHAKREGMQPDQPNFTKILDKIGLSTYVLPNLPLPLYQLLHPKPTPPGGGGNRLPSLSGTTGSGTDDLSQSSQTAISGLTTPSLATTTGTIRTQNTAVHNPTPDATVQALIPTNVRIKDLVGTDPVPRNEAGTPMCLSYHVRGICFSNCRRKADHERPLSTKDKTTLSNWLVDQLAKQRTAGLVP